MPKITYHKKYDYYTTFEQTDEFGGVTCEIGLRIKFSVLPPGGDGWNEPRYPAQAEFLSVEREIEPYRQPRNYKEVLPGDPDDALYWWAQDFVDNHQDELLYSAQVDETRWAES